MNTYIPIIFIYACVTVCSTGKTVEEDPKKTGKETEKEAEVQYDYYNGRLRFDTKEDIPEDYLNYLTDYYNIKEDPLAEIEGRTAHAKTNHTKAEQPVDVKQAIPVTASTSTSASAASSNITAENSTTLEDAISVIDSNSTDDSNTTTNSTTCKQCEMREGDKQLRIEGIKKQILGKLGFSSTNLPNVTHKQIPRTPSFERLVEQYEMQGDAPYGALDDEYLPEDSLYGDIHRAYTIGQTPPEEFGNYPSGACFFDIPDSVKAKKIQDATLWVYLERPTTTAKKHVTEIFIYVIPEKSKPAHMLKGPVRYSKTSSYGWQEFKMAHIVHHWVKKPDANKGIVIHAMDEDGNNLAVFPELGANENYYPTLEMATTEHKDKQHRSKRSVNNICTESERVEACCRYPLRVDFVQFGWDWVIAPTGYRANYCSGECQFRHIDNNPNAYLIQQVPEGGSGPCCTPNKLYPLAMLYFDHSHTVLYTYMQKMIVVRCGCA